MLGKHLLAKRIFLDLPNNLKPRSLEAQVETTDSGEQATNRQRMSPSFSGSYRTASRTTKDS